MIDVARSSSSVPIIDSVGAMALSLFAFHVNITLLTDGGQSVTLYTVSVCVCVCVDVGTSGMYIDLPYTVWCI